MIISRFENSPSRGETRDARTRTIDAERGMFRTLTLCRIGALRLRVLFFLLFFVLFNELRNYPGLFVTLASYSRL